MPKAHHLIPRSWQFLDDVALIQTLAHPVDTGTGRGLSFQQGADDLAVERAGEIVLNGFAQLLDQQRPPFVLHHQPGRQGMQWPWWCTGVVDLQDSTVVMLCLPQRHHPGLDATLVSALSMGSGTLPDGWLAIGTIVPEGLPPRPLRSMGRTLLSQWSREPDHPHRGALLDLGEQVPIGGLHTALVAWERAQLQTGMGTAADGPRGPRCRL